ncbi:hypothetical protein U9M48_039582 [Paspalum notatum var. saurae]|uniref:Aspartic peptidase DDI1-type domain-containing protein n=1 Tax=Paspalum notatum var. saurae TaxID=547442 RepID=A0AAQ3UP83_PASNO
MVDNDSSSDDDDIEDEVNEVIKKAATGMNMVFYLTEDFRPPSSEQMAESMAHLSLSPAAVIFEKPIDKKYRHLKPLYVKGFVNGKPVSGMLVDVGATVNIMPYSLCRKIGRSIDDLVKTNVRVIR